MPINVSSHTQFFRYIRKTTKRNINIYAFEENYNVYISINNYKVHFYLIIHRDKLFTVKSEFKSACSQSVREKSKFLFL